MTPPKTKPRASQIATADDFRAGDHQPLTLPSGRTVLVRPVHPFDLARRGADLANPLLEQIVAGETPDGDQRSPLQQATHLVELIDITCCCALVQPRMEPNGSGDTLSPSDMSMTDRQAIFDHANREAADAVARFRPEPADAVAAVDDGPRVEDTPK